MRKDYYVYIYLDQRKPGQWIFEGEIFNYKPFYIGKGCKKRDSIHTKPYMLKQKNFKNSIIKSIIKETNELPIHYRVFNGLTNDEALNKEIEMISFFGRRDNGTGILSNLTDGGDGSINLSEETKNEIINKSKKVVYQYSLSGELMKKWDSLSNTKLNIGNISTAIKRNGTYNNSIWSYEFLGEFIEPKIKYQMPNKYTNIRQIDKVSGELIKIFNSALDIEKELKLRSGARNKIYECINNKIKTAYGYKWEI